MFPLPREDVGKATSYTFDCRNQGRSPTQKGETGMYSKSLIGLLAIAMTAGAFGGTFSLFDAQASTSQEQLVA